LIQHTRDTPPPLSEVAPQVPVPIAEAIERNLAKEPELRSSDARALGCDLLRAAAESGVPSDRLHRPTLIGSGEATAHAPGATRPYTLSEETRARMAEAHPASGEAAAPGGAGLARSLKRLLPAIALLSISAPARAGGIDQVEHLRLERDDAKESFGMAEFGVGLLTLPTAEVCVEREAAGCNKGDRSLSISAWPLFRRDQFAVGAGVSLGLTPTADAPRDEDPNLAELDRDHKRSYYTFEITARYYMPINETLDGWVGATTGLVVVNDTFQTQNGLTERALVGPRGVTILTEGGTVGAGGGLAWAFSKNWLFGGSLRFANWFLPSRPAKDPIGDEASLDGSVLTIDLGISVAYRSRFIF
jgi:hypothetical protein